MNVQRSIREFWKTAGRMRCADGCPRLRMITEMAARRFGA